MTLYLDCGSETQIGGKHSRKISQDGGQQSQAQVEGSRAPVNGPVCLPGKKQQRNSRHKQRRRKMGNERVK